MKLYNPSGSRAWLNSADRKYRKPTRTAGSLVDKLKKFKIIDVKWYSEYFKKEFTDHEPNIKEGLMISEIADLLKVSNKRAKLIIRILIHGGFIDVKTFTSGSINPRKYYYLKKTIKEHDIEDASTY